MSTATTASRRISFGNLLATIFKIQLRSSLLSRKTALLLAINFLPFAGALVYFLLGGESGSQLYKILVEYVTITFLIPLVCLFNGGPAVVEEIEGRTAVYLFLRPVSKPAIFLAKTLAGSVVSVVVVVFPLILLFGVCMAAGGGFDENIKFSSQQVTNSQNFETTNQIFD